MLAHIAAATLALSLGAPEAQAPEKPYRVGEGSLRQVVPTLSKARARTLSRELGEPMQRYHITSERRASMFIAQTAHESGGYKHRSEIWGPSAVQAGYWRRADLGNSEPWHGPAYRGRGYIQITGRANYLAASEALDVSFMGLRSPKLASRMHAARSAAWWWSAHGCNQLASSGDFLAVTRRINGGTNGLADRLEYYRRALPVARWLVPKRR